MKYVVAVNEQEARQLASEIGHETREAALKHLEEVKAPPTDSFYAAAYKIFRVKEDDEP